MDNMMMMKMMPLSWYMLHPTALHPTLHAASGCAQQQHSSLLYSVLEFAACATHRLLLFQNVGSLQQLDHQQPLAGSLRLLVQLMQLCSAATC
jgi:hypothetical protein